VDYKLLFQILSEVIGGLGVFLLGMKYMSEGLQTISGDRLRKMISLITNNRFMGVLVGVAVTCIVQSSSVTTVMVVGFVNSGIMTLMQAIGVIFGANIGTTITGWILVLKIGKYGLPMLGIAAFFFLFSKRERLRYIGMAIMGVGMVFFGLELMKNGFKPIRSLPEFATWFQAFQATTYLGVIKCAAVGCILTMIVQSSSATLGITIGLASTGVIEFQTAAALVMGENIGTTITAWLASLGTTTTAKRAAYAHVLFNVIGTTWFIAMFPIAIKAVSALIAKQMGHNPLEINIDSFGDDDKFAQIITAGIALTHTSFNVANVLVFLPFAGLLGKLVTKLVPEKSKKEISHLSYLNVRMLDTPSLGIVQSMDEVAEMGRHTEKMFGFLRDIVADDKPNDELVKKLFHREEVLDIVQKEITEFLGNMLSGNVPHDVAIAGRQQIRMADEYESISDYLANILKLRIKLDKEGLSFTDQENNELMELHDNVADYVKMITDSINAGMPEIISKANTNGDMITHEIKELRSRHLERVGQKTTTPLHSLIYTDILNCYRRVKDHALNIAEALAGEK